MNVRQSSILSCVLLGTRDPNSFLRKLRGEYDVLRLIWSIVCEEWWAVHIDAFSTKETIPQLLSLPDFANEDVYDFPQNRNYPKERCEVSGCAVATVGKHLNFPPPLLVPMGTFENQTSENLYVNMMPLVVGEESTVPWFCKQYMPLISYVFQLSKFSLSQVVYLTIDERPVTAGSSQRRGGLHVESPGLLPILPVSDEGETMRYVASGRYVTGAEHFWGGHAVLFDHNFCSYIMFTTVGGMMMRGERWEGGIYMVSNMANTCAVWNSKVRDYDGSIIGPHGNIERLRPLLGPPSLLDAGEMVWMTDSTPHESLPVSNTLLVRQYFRLVVGQVTAWFADHSTPNPLGIVPPKEVHIVHGNKFSLYSDFHPQRNWEIGLPVEVEAIREEKLLRALIYKYQIGHLADRIVRVLGIRSIPQLRALVQELRKNGREGRDIAPFDPRDSGAHYHDRVYWNKLLDDICRRNKQTKL